jgi:hypothetical protein
MRGLMIQLMEMWFIRQVKKERERERREREKWWEK